MRKVLSVIVASFVFAACEGPQGEVGPRGPQGEIGLTGPRGEAGQDGEDGQDGQNASQPIIYDFNLDISGALPTYDYPTPLDPLDIVFVYINRGSSYAPLPFRGFARTVDNTDFVRLDCSYDAWKFFVNIDNDTVIPAGATFNFRAVILRGTKVPIGYKPTYEELSKRYNLNDDIMTTPNLSSISKSPKMTAPKP